jgi:hypothetical protein
MPVMTFICKWSEGFQEGVPRGLWAVKPDAAYTKSFAAVLNKLKEWQHKTGELRELKITVEYHYRKRTIDQNSLLWALYTVEANEMNAGMSGGKTQVRPEELYEADLLEYAPRVHITVSAGQAVYIRQVYRILEEKETAGGVILTAMITSSKFDTRQMAEWIDRIFNRLADHGVSCTEPGQIQQYWVEWRQHLEDQKIVLHETPMTAEAYKTLTPICEAHGANCYLGQGGDLSHIQARGMGGNPEAGKQMPSNWLHLCRDAHREWHDHGSDKFVTKYPHLKYKVLTALKRDYDPPSATPAGQEQAQSTQEVKSPAPAEETSDKGLFEDQCQYCGRVLEPGETCECRDLDIF